MSLTPEQIELRKLGITATDIAAIVGKHPWRSALDVWLEKTGQREPAPGNTRTKWGELLEPVIRDDYAARHGARVDVPGTLANREHEWQLATPDGIVYLGGKVEPERGLEIKVHAREAVISGSLHYGDPGTDDVPAHELIQCMWGMGVTGLPRWDLVPFISGSPDEYVIERDHELIGILRERGERFLVDNVRGGKIPEPDGSDSYGKWLTERWRGKATDKVLDVSNDLDAVRELAQLKEAKIASKRAEIALELIEQKIKARIGEHEAITWKDGKPGRAPQVTWKFNKDSEFTDLAGMVQHLKTEAGLIASAYAPELDTLEMLLRKVGGGYIGASTTSGVEMLKIVRAIRAKLTEIATAKTESFIKPSPGARQLRIPKAWHDEAKQS